MVLKQKLEYKLPFTHGNIRPRKVMQALTDLCATPLYKDAGINISPSWKSKTENCMESETPSLEIQNPERKTPDHIEETIFQTDNF